MILSSITEDQQGNISGFLSVSRPFGGSGPFSGKVNSNNSIQFTVQSNDGSNAILAFSGVVRSDGSLNGTYRVVNNGQTGTWHVTPS